ncbi:GntR family transcriptional regulator [Paenibacillus sp. GSMTC-2017]|uniref:GntR family transcriptional regulator n=1 Tax=Paenibacillus sp. GSMTC-2017 TaxID=2794350 RepID=UPI0018D68873|nr:GntR family transcriptional regulator [Paenibacillus sp. GSMTC-2017]MBH5318984.1 GntR family transcriptional regulator [Paenibacillus sp. GSMTC-2017]
MLLGIDLQSETPIYTQLVNGIIEGIARKQLLPGEALPSVRSLAGDLGINLHTVNKAYHLLKQEGYVQINRKQGVVIQLDAFPAADEHFRVRLKEQLRPLIAEAICRGMAKEQFNEISFEVFTDMINGGE